MNGSTARLLTEKDLGPGVAVIRGQVPPARHEDGTDREAIELANASIVAAALGLGIYIETLV
jgi:hypothetical protein